MSTVPSPSWVANSTVPYADQNNQDGNRLPSAPNSGAILTGGTVVRGPYNFDDGQAPSDPNWGLSGGSNGGTLDYVSNYMRGTWPANINDVGPYASVLNVAQERYITFRARFPAGSPPWGHKFIKIVGENNGSGTHSFTIGIDYAGGTNSSAPGAMIEVSYGDGSSTSGDTAQTLSYDEANKPSSLGRNTGTIVKSAPNGYFPAAAWNGEWHELRIYVRNSSGTTAETEQPDGAVYVEIDGVLILDVGGIFTRHWSNSLDLRGLNFFGVMQSNNPATEFHYDGIQETSGAFE
jgi:hypothetical protein